MMSSRTTADSLNYCDRLPLIFRGVQTHVSCFKGHILFSCSSVCSEFYPSFLWLSTLRGVAEASKMCGQGAWKLGSSVRAAVQTFHLTVSVTQVCALVTVIIIT
jgi:hypothetical protein